MVCQKKINICNLLCAKRQGFSVAGEIKEIVYAKAERIFIDKAIESKECQLKVKFLWDLLMYTSVD